jgi:hypothetical protein
MPTYYWPWDSEHILCNTISRSHLDPGGNKAFPFRHVITWHCSASRCNCASCSCMKGCIKFWADRRFFWATTHLLFGKQVTGHDNKIYSVRISADRRMTTESRRPGGRGESINLNNEEKKGYRWNSRFRDSFLVTSHKPMTNHFENRVWN